MNYARAYPKLRPWARDLDAGDILSLSQRIGVSLTRLNDFGLELRERDNGTFIVQRTER